MATSSKTILGESAVDLAAMMRQGEVSPVAVVDAFIARIEAVNPVINALVGERFDAARNEARAAEARYSAAKKKAKTDLPPFLGVPCSIKEAICVEGLPNTSGSHYRRGLTAPRDAAVVTRMKAAGFIPLGVTNTPDCCYGVESANVVHGRTRNPHDLKRIPGGSSGGEGALIAAGGTPLGIGSDLGGSIRMPAHFNGIFGHKPSGGLVPFTDHFPFYKAATGDVGGPFAWTGSRQAMTYNTIGPLARHAQDLMPVLRVLSGRDDFDASCEDMHLEELAHGDWRGRRVFLLADPFIARTQRASSDQRLAVARAGQHFAERGAVVRDLPRTKLRDAFRLWVAAMHDAQMPPLDEILAGGNRPSVIGELLRWSSGKGRHTLTTLVYLIGERLQPSMINTKKFMAELESLTVELNDLLKGGGLLLMPTYPTAAPKHYAALLTPFDPMYTGIVNALRMPATAIPMGSNARGLPLGVQAISARGRDDVTIAAAIALEEAFGGSLWPERFGRQIPRDQVP